MIGGGFVTANYANAGEIGTRADNTTITVENKAPPIIDYCARTTSGSERCSDSFIVNETESVNIEVQPNETVEISPASAETSSFRGVTKMTPNGKDIACAFRKDQDRGLLKCRLV